MLATSLNFTSLLKLRTASCDYLKKVTLSSFCDFSILLVAQGSVYQLHFVYPMTLHRLRVY